jgi:uncharacterized protein with HEPN domain
MRAMRNRILHDYFQVDEKLLWDTIQNLATGQFGKS